MKDGIKRSDGVVTRPTLVFRLPDRRAFLAAYFHQGELGALFVPGDSQLRAGDHTELMLRFEEERREFHTRGVVRWKRSTASPRLPSGIAVELAASERQTRDLLLEFARGREVRWVARRDRRLPVGLEIRYASDSVLLSDYSDDLSHGGAFIRGEELPEIGTELILRIRPPGELFSIRVKGRVVWQQQVERRGVGVRFIFDNPRAHQRFAKLIEKLQERVERAFEIHAAAGLT